MNSFDKAVEKANRIEQYVASLLKGKDTFVTKGEHNCDIYFNENGETKRVEVKSHPASFTTNKIAVEFFNFYSWKTTGLSVTKAEYWVEVFYNKDSGNWEIYKYPTKEYKEILSKAIRRGKMFITKGGDGQNSGMILIYINYLTKASQKYYIGIAPKELFEYE